MDSMIVLRKIRSYFEGKLASYGPTPQGVDWNSDASQEIRFEQLIKVCDTSQEFSINDYGCGYGALIDYLTHQNYKFQYVGFDIVEKMLHEARKLHGDNPLCSFTTQEVDLPVADYTIESGIFNLRLEANEADWREYVLETLGKMNSLSKKGFSFNLLTQYSDAEFMRPDLYYADPGFFFDYCKIHFSRNIALLHDYDLYDFTIIVRKQ